MEIELPDGTILEAPDDADPSVVAKAYLNQQRRGPATVLNAVGQGLTFGFADELAAGAAATYGGAEDFANYADMSRQPVREAFGDPGRGERYEEALSRERENLSAAREDYPLASFAGEVAGGATTGIKAGMAVAPYLKNIPNLARLFGLGATEGAIYGAGASDENRGVGAGVGAAIGAVSGPIGVAASKAAGGVVNKLVKPAFRAMNNTPERQAARIVLDALNADDITPEEALLKLNELGPNAVLADVGANVASVGRGAAGKAGPAKTIANSFLSRRHAGQSQRLIDAAIPGTDVQAFRKGFSEFLRSRQSRSQPLYQEAFSKGLEVTETLQSLMGRPAIKQALRDGARMLADEGGGAGHVRLFDYAKQSLDDRIGTAIRAGNRNEARILTRLKNQLLDEIDTQLGGGNPANSPYRQARELFAGEAQLRDAADMGRSIFRGRVDLDDLAATVEAMGEGERALFRVGAVRGLIDAIESTAENRNVAQTLLKSPRTREILRYAFPDNDAFERFIATAQAESIYTGTRNTILGGSRTAEFLQDTRNIDQGASALSAAFRGNDPISAGVQMLKSLGFGEASEETLAEVARILFTRGPGRAVIEQQAARAARPRISGQAMNAGVTGGSVSATQAAQERQ